MRLDPCRVPRSHTKDDIAVGFLRPMISYGPNIVTMPTYEFIAQVLPPLDNNQRRTEQSDHDTYKSGSLRSRQHVEFDETRKDLLGGAGDGCTVVDHKVVGYLAVRTIY